MHTPLQVRTATPADYPAVGELTASVYEADGWGTPGYLAELRDVAGRARHAQVLLAESGGALVGAVTVATRGGPVAEQAVDGEAVVRMLVTGPAARGRGVGQTLMRACLAAARADGCHLVRLSTQPGMHTAHRLYERLGFRRTPDHDWAPVPELLLITYALALLPHCDRCGRDPLAGDHARCATDLEPPRFCAQCGRRMVVQVVPDGWTARCVEHGTRRG